MIPRMTVQTRVGHPRGLRLGPLLLWCAPVPRRGPNLVGRIAITDTPCAPAPGQRVMRDGNGWIIVFGGVEFVTLRCRSVPVR